MAVMMSGGIGLRVSGLAPERFIAVFYTGLGAALLLAGLRVLLCMMPQNQWLSADAPLSWGIYRNIPFALLGLLWTALLLQIKQIHLSAALALAGCFALLVALADETIQLFSPGRGSQVTDVWIDFAGACLGILLAWLLRWLRIHVQSKHAKKHGSFRD